MASVIVACPSCGKGFSLNAKYAGRTAKCGCGARLKVPIPDTPVSLPAKDPPAAIAEETPKKDDFDWDKGLSESPPAPVVTMPPNATGSSLDEQAFRSPQTEAEHDEPQLSRGSSFQLKILGIYGIIIMIAAALLGIVNVIGGIIYVVNDPDYEHIVVHAALFAVIAVQSVVYFVLFRLGQGLLNSERSSVGGLCVLFVIACCGAGALYYYEQSMAAAVVATAAGFLMGPPILLGFLNWESLYSEQ